MNIKVRTIEVDTQTAELLEARASAREDIRAKTPVRQRPCGGRA